MSAKRDFTKQLTQLYMDAEFTLPTFSFEKATSYKKLDVRSRKYITDFDGVFEKEGTDPLYKLFFYALEEESKKEIEAKQLLRLSERISVGESPTEIFRQMKIYLQSRRLTKEIYDNACKRAAKKWQAVDDAWQTVNEIKKLGYNVAIISGSPQEALERAAKKIGIVEDVYGTRFEFEGGRLKEIQHMLGQAKLERKNRIVGENESISVTDDMGNDYFITYAAQLAIVVAENDKKILQNEKQVYVFDQKIRRNFIRIKYYLRKFNYSVERSHKTTKTIERRIVEYVLNLKTALQNENRKEILHQLLLLRYGLAEFDPFSSSDGEKTITEYKHAEDAETEKRLKLHILSILQQIPEFVNTDEFAKVVNYEYEPQ